MIDYFNIPLKNKKWVNDLFLEKKEYIYLNIAFKIHTFEYRRVLIYV